MKQFDQKFNLGKKESVLEEKIAAFKYRLKSKKPQDVKANAEILAEILKNFSFSFGLDVEEILKVMEGEKDGEVNLQSVRNKLFKLHN